MPYRLLSMLLVILPLAGCNPKIVKVPIPVPCVEKLPATPVTCEPADDSRAEWLRCELVNCSRTRGYTLELEAVMEGCVK